MGDGIDMQTDAVAESGRRLETSGERLSTSWTSARAGTFEYAHLFAEILATVWLPA